ncbi:hypothetical protein EDD27_2702 [Nonomuraea polychroma]|uniref:Uncharacterized protein n=1 Tax=Nonomuraea polychroma TaxID=46176 RepID=A0A438M4D0_9ACTN|nr:hypothetical protein [Nonomuraea polychroma]RVX40298.1 hypothetical protein EDD27_2702 [Nonomuraea polychroma]
MIAPVDGYEPARLLTCADHTCRDTRFHFAEMATTPLNLTP